MQAILEIKGVSKRFGQYRALDAIHLAVEEGEFVALLGPSGCGKTTLLKSIAGFLQPDEGQILIGGKEVTHLSPHLRPLNTVFQNYALFPHMNVLDNVAYGPRRQGVRRREAYALANETLALVGLSEFGPRFPRELSGGQQQRVALARAVVNRPKILLLDEPLSALDLKLRKRMQLELKHLQSKLGIAFLFVTHDQEEAMTMADRIVVLNEGRVEQIGAGEEIYRAPVSRFVAEFIGEANLFEFNCDERGRLQLTTLQVELETLTSSIPGGLAILRPEQLYVYEKPHEANGPPLAQEPGQVCLNGQVTEMACVGSHTMIHVAVSEQILMARATGMPSPSLRPGVSVDLKFKVTDLHLMGERP
jgi:spermidine/putrescine transport system ATP-binding protein